MSATYNLPDIKQGDTFKARNIATITVGGSPLVCSRAKMEIRDADGNLIAAWDTAGAGANATITGAGSNVVNIQSVSHTLTKNWPLGVLYYDMEAWLGAAQEKTTLLSGTQTVTKSITANE